MRLARSVLPLILLVVAKAAWAEQTDSALERSVYPFPAWDAAVTLTDVEKYSSEAEYVAARGSGYVLEKIRYRSDDLFVIAYYYHPRNAEAMKRPVIVYNRGSDGGEGRDEMGGADLNDLMNVIPLLNQLDSLDTRNVFLYGESRGGMMVFQAIRDGFAARAAATVGAFTDLGEMTSSGPGAAMATTIWPDFDERRSEIISRRSAIRWPEKLGLPLLLMHGSKDGDVAPAQTLLLASELAKAQKEFGVIVFPGGDHTLRQY